MSTRAFISSTSYDLGDYRKAAIEVCNRLQVVPISMEYFDAMGAGATEGSKQQLAESDLYIGIFAHRYGYTEDGFDRSVTEIEFDHAGELRLDRLCFSVDPKHPWPTDAIDYDKHEQLVQFRHKVDALIRAEFTTVDNFRSKLMGALGDWCREHAKVPDAGAQAPSSDVNLSPTSPPSPSLVVGREADLSKLRDRLGVSGTQHQLLTVVRGWPGVGKTTLVTALAHEADVSRRYPDGQLWAFVGEDPEPTKQLRAWALSLAVNIDGAATLDEAMSTLRAVLRDKKCLLIVDDVWAADDALPFRIAGQECSTIVTTRFGDVARELAVTPDDVYLLDRLGDEEGFELLSRLSPRVVETFAAESRQLVRDVEGLPLALRVAGRFLESEASAGFDVAASFRALGEEATLLREKAPEDRYDPRTGTTPTVDLLLKKSTDRLDEATRERFAYLGAFAPKPATFDLDAMKAVWELSDAQPICRRLVDRGLLEPIPALGRFWMHAVLAMHAKSLLESMEE